MQSVLHGFTADIAVCHLLFIVNGCDPDPLHLSECQLSVCLSVALNKQKTAHWTWSLFFYVTNRGINFVLCGNLYIKIHR